MFLQTVELVGYIARYISAKQSPNWTTMPYVIQELLLLVAPSLFAASIYMVLGRIIRLLNGDSNSPIRPSWLTKIFVAGDVISFFMQSGGMISTNLTYTRTWNELIDQLQAVVFLRLQNQIQA